jgi:predicted nucleotidyltransferase
VREAHAWEVARRAATLLASRFGATRVVVFGSLTRPHAFTPWSDVDIAAWGLKPRDTFAAVAALLGFDADIEVNLVDVGACSPEVLAAIEREGRAP